MRASTSDGVAVAPVYADDARLQPLIGPGGPFEVGAVVVDGIPLRDFVRAPRTIVDIFGMGATHEDLVHIVYGDERLTFGEVRRRSLSLAHELQSAFGVGRGDRVAIAMRNLPEFVVSFWGAALVGGIVVPLNSWWKGAELVYALQNSGATLAFVDGERMDQLRAETLPSGLRVVGIRASTADIPFDDLVHGAGIDQSAVAQLGPDDPVTLLYTSGTTGRPKGALGTNRAAIANLVNMAFANAREAIIAGREARPPAQPATLSTQPLFHVGGVASIIGAPIGGTKLVMMRKWDVDEAVRLARQQRVTSLGGVPTIARQLIEYPGIGELGLDIRGVPLGGAAVPPDLPLRTRAVFGPTVQILNGYGSTETTSAVVVNVGVEFEARPDSVGRPNLTADARVAGPDGQWLPTGEVGELCFRSPQVVKGYWNDDAATAESFRDGWFHTGDVGSIDGDGFVYVVDRLKDVVIRGGENVYCVEVEDVLHHHPDVADVAVVGMSEPVMGERVCAVVVPRRGAHTSLARLRAFAAERLAAFKCPEALSVTDELPRTATGKVDKKALRLALSDQADVDRLW